MSTHPTFRFGQAPATSVLTRGGTPIAFTSGARVKDYTVRTSANGNPVVENLRVFKVGTFKDSLGIENTWERFHLEQMIFHFDYLLESGIFPNVPLRADHSMSVDDVIGYIEALRLHPEDENFLAADVEFTEPEAWEKWDRGTYRSRSLEVGMYESNDGAVFFPVVFGLAFVDIPAVEGLYSSGNPARFNFRQVIHDQEESMDPITRYCNALARWQAAYDEGRWVDAVAIGNEFGGDHGQALNAYTYARFEEACNYAKALADQANPPAPGTSTPPAAPANHGAPPAPAPYRFRVNGSETIDFAAVQAHIDGLEEFRRTSIREGRHSYVDTLATEGKIGQPQVDTMKALVATMSEDQFAAFRSSYEAAPKLSLLHNHGGLPSGGGQPADPADDDEIALVAETVRNHQRAGTAVDKIKAMGSWSKLVKLCEARGESPDKYVTL